MPPANSFTACKACRRLRRKCSRDIPSCHLVSTQVSQSLVSSVDDDSKCVRLGKVCDYGQEELDARKRTQLTGAERQQPVDLAAELEVQRKNRFPVSYFLDPDLFQQIGSDTLMAVDNPFFINQQRRLASSGSFQSLIDGYEATIHNWLPMLSLKRLRQDANSLASTSQGIVDVLIFLALEALSSQNVVKGSGNNTPPQSNSAYLNVKHYSFTAETGGAITIRLIQTIALLALYELGHGIYPAAYLTIGQAVRLATMVGLHSQKQAKQLFVDADTWTLCEEQRRTWWTILMLDRVVVANSPGLLMAALDPSTSDLLPCSDDDWTAGQIGFNEALLTRNLHSPPSLGTFARACQATHMLGKVIRHVQARARVEDVSGHTSEALQLHMALKLLDQGVAGDCAHGRAVRSSLHLALSLCRQARLVLYNQYACNEPGQALPTERLASEVEMQQISLTGIRELAAKTVPLMAREMISDHQQQSAGLSYSPVLAGCLYHAATECAWFIKENDEIEMVNGLESIVQALRVLKSEWSVCDEYLGYLVANGTKM